MSALRAWTDDMGEISGFGGSYEAACRTMVLRGLEWLDEHPSADPQFHGFKNVYGLLVEDNEDAKALSKAITGAAGDCTGAMHQACVSIVLYVKKHGWEAFCAKRREARS